MSGRLTQAVMIVARMENTFTGLRPLGGPNTPDDPVLRWRQEWERDIAEAEGQDGPGDARVAANRRDYGSYLFIALDLVLAIVAQIVLSIPLVLLAVVLFVVTGHSLVSGGKPSVEFEGWLAAPLFTLFGLVVTDGSMLLVVWYRLGRQKLSWALVGLDPAAWRRRVQGLAGADGQTGPGPAILFGLGIGVVGLILSSVMGSILQRLGLDQSGQDKLLIEPLKSAPLWVVLAMVFGGTFIAPAVEEIFFRGYIFRAVAVRKGVPVGYIVSAGAFAAFHLTGGLDLWPIVPVLFVIGLLLCFAYRRTGNLLADITAHAVNNGAAFAFALLLHP